MNAVNVTPAFITGRVAALYKGSTCRPLFLDAISNPSYAPHEIDNLLMAKQHYDAY